MKSLYTDIEIKTLVDKMSQNDSAAILYGAKSDSPILNLNAVLFGAKFGYKSQEYIDILKTKLRASEASFMGTPLKIYVDAALDVIGAQKYNGDDADIQRLIDSKFNF